LREAWGGWDVRCGRGSWRGALGGAGALGGVGALGGRLVGRNGAGGAG
jgi:hypothetical protein